MANLCNAEINSKYRVQDSFLLIYCLGHVLPVLSPFMFRIVVNRWVTKLCTVLRLKCDEMRPNSRVHGPHKIVTLRSCATNLLSSCRNLGFRLPELCCEVLNPDTVSVATDLS